MILGGLRGLKDKMIRLFLFAVLMAALPLLGACGTAPATGETFFTGGLSEEQEAKLGAQEHKKILQQFGGAYNDPELTRYIDSIGTLLVSSSETPNQKFTFTVLDSPIVNAFALPGGYVYITRGLLALADDEAEVAGVLAHEIGHVTARHASQRYGQTMAANVLATGVGILLGSREAANAAGTLGALAVRSYSRDQEFEADLLGVRYLSRVGYEPEAMAGFLTTLQAHSRLQATIAGNPEAADSFDIMQTHPRTADRIRRAIAQAGETRVADPMDGRDIYLSKINGLLYGDNPKEGVIQRRKFLHPDLRFEFEVPPGFRLINTSRLVAAEHKNGSTIIFDRAPKPVSGRMSDYLTRVWGRDVRLSGVEDIEINGLDAATGQARVTNRQSRQDLRLLAIRFDPDTTYRFLFFTSPAQTAQMSEGLRRTTYSFRKLTSAEAAAIKPKRLRLYTVASGENAQRIAGRFPFEDFQLERFETLNGLSRNATLRTGQTVKIITQ